MTVNHEEYDIGNGKKITAYYDDKGITKITKEMFEKVVIPALRKAEQYKWHDLRKNPDDLPPVNPKNTYENDVLLYVVDDKGVGNIFKGHLSSREHKAEWDNSGKQNVFGLPTFEHNWCIWGWSYYNSYEVIAWAYIPPFEEVEG